MTENGTPSRTGPTGRDERRRRKGRFFVPGLLYDLAFAVVMKGLRRLVAATVEREGLWPWLDVCSGTGSQFRALGRGTERGHVPSALGRSLKRGHVPPVRVPDRAADGLAVGLDLSLGFVRYAAARAPGVPFVCGDAAELPFKSGALRAVSVSFGLHDKDERVRAAMMAEARRVLDPGAGRLIAVDFENPWSRKSRRGAFAVHLIERTAGGDHYRNGREFLRRGGLRAFLREHGFAEEARRDVESASIGVVVARPGAGESRGAGS